MEGDFVNEISNKIIHLLILILLIAYFGIEAQSGKQIALIFLLGVLLFFLVLEYFRLDLGWKMSFFSVFIRPKEHNRMYGAVFFLSAAIICLAVLDTEIALAALLMTVFGDMVAAIIGRRYGSTLIYRNKTIIGFFAGLVTNLVVAFVMIFIISTNIYVLLVMALIVSVIETLADDLDDNLLVPLFAGFIGQMINFLL